MLYRRLDEVLRLYTVWFKVHFDWHTMKSIYVSLRSSRLKRLGVRFGKADILSTMQHIASLVIFFKTGVTSQGWTKANPNRYWLQM
jgi:hypothetical protein